MSDLGEQELGRSLLEAGEAPGPACPQSDRLWELVEGSIPTDEALALVLHAGSCSGCGVGLRLARALQAERRGPVLVAVSRPVGLGKLLSAGAGATLLAAAAVLLTARPAPPPSMRAPTAAVIRALAGEGRVSRAGLVLRWTPQPGARYSVRLATEDLSPVLSQTGLSAAQFEVPPPSLAAVPRGARLFWTVTAQLADGGMVASPAFLLILD